jgi:hypothetical protein
MPQSTASFRRQSVGIEILSGRVRLKVTFRLAIYNQADECSKADAQGFFRGD